MNNKTQVHIFFLTKIDFYGLVYKTNVLYVVCFQNIPPDLSQCVFVIEQALSVRALQELVTAAGSETVRHNRALPCFSVKLTVVQSNVWIDDGLSLKKLFYCFAHSYSK